MKLPPNTRETLEKLLALVKVTDRLKEQNLFDTERLAEASSNTTTKRVHDRTPDGRNTDPKKPEMGMAGTLFPERPRGYVKTTKLLQQYAWEVMQARKDRLAGDISSALLRESRSDNIYSPLPSWGRW